MLTFLSTMVLGMVAHDRIALFFSRRATERAESERVAALFEKDSHDDECIRPEEGAPA